MPEMTRATGPPGDTVGLPIAPLSPSKSTQEEIR
jgi:hypothetical protein